MKRLKNTILAKFWSFLALLTILLLNACFGPAKKPVPPLDLSKALVEKKSAEKPKAPVKAAQISRMSVSDFYQLGQRDAALLFDVRPTIFYKMGKIPGAISWPLLAFDRDFKTHEKILKAARKQNQPIVLYCTDLACPDAGNVALKLSARGYDIAVLEGGYEAWKMLTQ